MAQLQLSSTDTIAWSDGYGNSHDGNITIGANTTDTSANTAGLSGTSGTKTATVTDSTGFAIGDIVILHQTRHTSNHDVWQFNKITNIVGNTITFKYDLVISFDSTGNNDAQMYECKQYANVTINSTYTWTGQAYNRSTGKGGIFWFFHTGKFTNNGSSSVDGKGFIGGEDGTSGHYGGYQGDSYKDNGNDSEGDVANDGAGGRGDGTNDADGAGGGGGAGHASDGVDGNNGGGGSGGGRGLKGLTHGEADLNTMYLGSGGGGGGYDQSGGVNGGSGGNGAGIFGCCGQFADISSGNIYARGAVGGNANGRSGAGGGGAGGSVFIKANRLILGTDKIIFSGGAGGSGATGGAGGAGSIGRCRIEYGNSYTGSVTSASIAQDRTLVGNAASMFSVF